MTRFPIAYDRPMRLLMGLLGLGPRSAWLEVDDEAGIVRLKLSPAQEARALGRRVRLATLEVSVDDPDALLSLLGAAG
jgi:hypothetical protein